jgi:hypothetical protein
MSWEKVEFKLSQADRALETIANARNREEFYDGLSLFLSAARSAVAVMAFQYGLHEFEIGEKAAGTNGHLVLDTAARAKRQAFDAWFRHAAKPVLSHPLKEDRDADVHREGSSSAKFQLPPGAGLLLEPGGPTGRERKGVGSHCLAWERFVGSDPVSFQ